ncbi:hypothetical protein BD410DRAFT_765290 [Rickenella mellea]|uniref:HNH nuclease domain-containing protein n=1 Tax=Rickenella mellea TaxID=50990 RepID=A0A4Y7QD94_9AGAM|nr:hypothetical protein BD410DRAFT_765290 [Rickenella mellea]
MPPLSTFSLPLSALPAEYGWIDRDYSELATTTDFNTGIDERDTFLGARACVICGNTTSLRRCHIIPAEERETWSNLRARGWIPQQAEKHPNLEPRNGMIMCVDHQLAFNAKHFFVRFVPDTRRFVFINYSENPSLQPFHGKAIALDINHRHAPFPSLCIIHELRVRGFNPFKLQPIVTVTPDDSPWQDWIMSNGVFNNDSGTFNRSIPPPPDTTAISAPG